MAFDLFLGLLPIAAIAGWALSLVVRTPEQSTAILSSLVDAAPGPAANLVHEQVRRLGEHGGTIAPLSTLGFIWIASGGAHTAMSSIQSARTSRTRSWVVNRAIAIGVVLVFLVLLVVPAGAIVWAETWLQRSVIAGRLGTSWAIFARSGAVLLSNGVATVGTAMFYGIATWRMEGRHSRTIWPGAFGFASLWALVSWAFSAYVTAIGRYSLFYGSLAAVALLLIWLWLSSFLLLVGSELNLQLEGTRKTIIPASVRLFKRASPASKRIARTTTPSPPGTQNFS